MDTRLEIGSINRAHGLKGEVIVQLLSNVEDRLKEGTELEIQESGKKLVIETSRAHKDKFIVVFEGVRTRESAQALAGSKLTAPPIEGLDSEDLWLHQLVGCEVVDQHGENRGKVLQLEANPASDLLVLDTGALVPVRFIVSEDSKTLHVEVPEGLF